MVDDTWLSKPLGELCDPARGITYGIVKVGDFIPGGVPVIRGGDIRQGRIVCDDSKRVTEEVSNQFRRTILKGGEIVLNLIADPGHSAIVPRELAGHNVSRDVAVIPVHSEVDVRFVDFFLKSKIAVEWLTARLQGSVTQKINLGILRELPVPFPPLGEQKSIAAVLGALDDKIELNRRMNATLEAMARALFQSWFVDFDPVRAKLDGRAPIGLDADTVALFPSAFQNSPLGPIPRGWQVDTIKNRATKIQYGLTQSATVEAVGPRFLRITDIRGGNVDWSAVPYCYATNDEQERYRIQDGDIFIARTGASTGDSIYVVDPPSAVFASYLVRIQFSSRGVARLVGEYVRTPDYANYISGSIGGSAQPNASAQTLAAASMVFPTETLADAFYERVRVLDLKRAANDRESRTLAELRDTLLPKLLSGELSVAGIPA